jgi:sortase A
VTSGPGKRAERRARARLSVERRARARLSVERRARARLGALLWGGERLLVAAGTVALAVYAGACVHATLHQQREMQRFDHALEARRSLPQPGEPDMREWSSERIRRYEEARGTPVEALARLDIPHANVSVMVLDGTDDQTLELGVGRIEGTARPGEPGNVGIAGHRDGFFRGVRHLERGDAITLTTLEGVVRYEVTDLRIVDPDDVEVLAPTAQNSLTLVTCYPFYYVGAAPRRFVVRAREIQFEPWSTRTADVGG